MKKKPDCFISDVIFYGSCIAAVVLVLGSIILWLLWLYGLINQPDDRVFLQSSFSVEGAAKALKREIPGYKKLIGEVTPLAPGVLAKDDSLAEVCMSTATDAHSWVFVRRDKFMEKCDSSLRLDILP